MQEEDGYSVVFYVMLIIGVIGVIGFFAVAAGAAGKSDSARWMSASNTLPADIAQEHTNQTRR